MYTRLGHRPIYAARDPMGFWVEGEGGGGQLALSLGRAGARAAGACPSVFPLGFHLLFVPHVGLSKIADTTLPPTSSPPRALFDYWPNGHYFHDGSREGSFQARVSSFWRREMEEFVFFCWRRKLMIDFFFFLIISVEQFFFEFNLQENNFTV